MPTSVGAAAGNPACCASAVGDKHATNAIEPRWKQCVVMIALSPRGNHESPNRKHEIRNKFKTQNSSKDMEAPRLSMLYFHFEVVSDTSDFELRMVHTRIYAMSLEKSAT
jgi:hypothetical protein